MCVSSSVAVVGASLDESISVPCRVNADPPDVEFEWSFSSSGERFEVPHEHYASVQDINIGGTDGSKSASTLYDSGETYGESGGKFPICLLNQTEPDKRTKQQKILYIFMHTAYSAHIYSYKHVLHTMRSIIKTETFQLKILFVDIACCCRIIIDEIFIAVVLFNRNNSLIYIRFQLINYTT